MTRRYYVSATVIIIAAAVIYWKVWVSAPATAGGAPPSVLVSTIDLTPGTLPATVSAYGGITAGPQAEVTVSMQAGGVIAAIAVVQGQRVAAGAPLLTITADAQSIADLRRAEDAVSAAKAGRAHVAALLASHLATNADLAAAEQMFNDASGALSALQAAGAGKTRTLIAPFAGVVSAVLVAPGAMQLTGAALLRMINTTELVAMIGVPPVQAAAIRPGDLATLELLDTGDAITGRVAQISSMLDPDTGLISVRVALQGQAVPGELVKAVITTGLLNGFVVPRDAVQNDQAGDYVFQIDARNIAHRVNVQVLGAANSQNLLAPKLNAALPMVTIGAYQLDDGEAVRLPAAKAAH